MVVFISLGLYMKYPFLPNLILKVNFFFYETWHAFLFWIGNSFLDRFGQKKCKKPFQDETWCLD